jgi:pimeloyl-ACP methyl ester carboxylesterase
MPFVQLSNVRLEYFRHGHGPEVLLLVHGFQASARIWHWVQQALPADRYTTIALNNRGAGASDAPPREDDYGVEIFAADAHEAIAQLAPGRFTLVGHSLGGPTAACFAVQWPHLLKGLVLLDPADPDGREMADADLEAIIDARMAARRAQREQGGGGDGITANAEPSALEEPMRALLDDMAAAPEVRLRGSLRSMFKVRRGAQLRALDVPSLLVGGDADELIPVASMLGTWAKLPAGAGLHFWHGVGHSPNLQCPQALADVLRHFVEVTIPARTRH